MNTKHRLVTFIGSIALAAFCAIGVATAGAQTYSLTDLGVLPGKKARVSTPAAINDQAQVAGTSGASSLDESAFLYDPRRGKEAMVDLGSLSRGFGINGVGDVVGDSTFGSSEAISHAALFKNGKTVDLGTLKTGLFSRATGINASMQVVGFSGPKRDISTSRAFFWSQATGLVDIGTLGGLYAQAFGINDSGFVTGTSQTADSSQVEGTRAFIYQPFSIPGRYMKQMANLGTLGGNYSYGMAINANNHVAGYSTINSSDDRVHAFLYIEGKMLDLGSLGGKELESDQSFALGINAIDQVVGWTYLPTNQGPGENPSTGPTYPPQRAAFIYSDGVMKDLNGLIGKAAVNYWLYSATAINNKQQIVAVALDNSTNEIHAVLLTP